MEIKVPLSQGLSLRINDTPPEKNGYPTGSLQKGFLLVDRDQDLAEEGVGFGVPVLKEGLQTIFPGKVSLTFMRGGPTWQIAARYKLNLVERMSRTGNEIVEDRFLYNVKNFLADVIRRAPLFRGLLTSASSHLRQAFRLETTYAQSSFTTDIEIVYTIQEAAGEVEVEMDTCSLPAKITEVVVMNEQGARSFDRYAEPLGTCLQGKEIGCWDEVKVKEAWFESSAHRVRFGLRQVKGTRLFRGRELISPRLAWAGFGYSFPPSIQKLRYTMRIEKLP